MRSLFDLNPFVSQADKDKRTQDVNRATAIVRMADSEGWKAFVAEAEELAASHTPEVSAFTPDMATQIASQMAFVSGIHRTIGLMEKYKDIVASHQRAEQQRTGN